MGNPVRDIPHYIRVFQEYLGARMYLVFALTLVATLAEGFGILMVLPLLETLDGGPGSVPSSAVGQYMHQILERLGLSDSTVGVLLFITAAFLLKGVVTFASQGYNAVLRGQLLRELKIRLFGNYSRMTLGYYSSRDTGHFVNVINEQITQMIVAFNSFVSFGSQAVNTFIYLLLAFVVAWRFGLMALVLGVVLLALFRWINSYVRQLSRRAARENGRLSKQLIQSLHAFKYLVATGQMPKLAEKVSFSIKRLTAFEIRRGIATAFTGAIREPTAVVFIVIIVMIQLVLLKQPLVPLLVSVILFYRAFNSIMLIQSSLQNSLERIGSLELVRDEFRRQQGGRELSGEKMVPTLAERVCFKNVWFRYDDAHGDVLKSVSLEIPVRTSVAFVGESGAGKSTMVDLLTLMLKPHEGSVLVDGIPGEEIQLDSWRSQLGYVSQETVVFDDTIANNICLWQGESQRDENLMQQVRKAATRAHLAEFIESLPQGFETLVGDRGMRLSGGQRQRLFIARELFRKPNLLILDEATSSLDSESERAVQQSIDELKGQMTVVIIAHRLSTVRNVDQIFVFDSGRLVEQGDFMELRNRVDSRFSKLAAMQAL